VFCFHKVSHIVFCIMTACSLVDDEGGSVLLLNVAQILPQYRINFEH
jgi:hypothetical protein